MTFTDAYAACPVCSPTRASIMTGKYPATLGDDRLDRLGDWDSPGSRSVSGRSLYQPFTTHRNQLGSSVESQRLPDLACRQVASGGRAIPCLTNHGFDVNLGGCEWGNPMNGYFSPYDIPTLENGPDGEYLTDRLTR